MSWGEDFAAQLKRVGGTAHRVNNLDDARAILENICEKICGPEPVSWVRWSTPLAEALAPQATAIDESLSESEVRARCFEARLGITEADWALADSGTLVLESGPGRSRLVSLLPTVHVALLPAGRILAGLGSLISRYTPTEGNRPMDAMSCLTFITGPSRTADIELTLTVGVHGPQAVHVIILEDG